MATPPVTFSIDTWRSFQVTRPDLEFIHQHLFETEQPLSSGELAAVLVEERIRVAREQQAKLQKGAGDVYLPKESYKKGQKLVFPALNMKKGQVQAVRRGVNPELGDFDVLDVELEDGSLRLFAAGLADHKLNDPVEQSISPEFDPQAVVEEFGEEIQHRLEVALHGDDSLVRIAGKWFPGALLMDINAGHLNLAEAVLEMASGEPMPVKELMEQIELSAGGNQGLTEFSLNYALQEDGRFDEVGPAGQVLWCLRRLEPEEVQQIPAALRYNEMDYNRPALTEAMLALEAQLDDELSETNIKPEKSAEVTVCLTYPHWRAGTLPVSNRVSAFFPTAYESPRIRFTLVDAATGKKIPAWVVREHGYVYGLREWFDANKLIPGGLVVIRKSDVPGEVIIESRARRASRDWVRTVISGSDGGLVFALLRQEVGCEYNDRMVIAVPDPETVHQAVSQAAKQRQSFEKMVKDVLNQLSKLTPQGHVHAEELYAAVNVLRRVPPGPLLALLAASKEFNHVGDLHFRLAETDDEE